MKDKNLWKQSAVYQFITWMFSPIVVKNMLKSKHIREDPFRKTLFSLKFYTYNQQYLESWMWVLKRSRHLFNFSKIKEYDYILHASLQSKPVILCYFFLNITINFLIIPNRSNKHLLLARGMHWIIVLRRSRRLFNFWSFP